MAAYYIKIFIFMLAVVITTIAIFEAHDSYVRSVELEFYRQHFNLQSIKFENNSAHNECRLPDYDPFDPTILKYIKKWPIISCGRSQYPLTYLDSDSYININESAVQQSGISPNKLQCSYHVIKRKPNDDFHFELGPPEVIITSETVDADFIVVRCHENLSLRRIYETGHFQITPVNPELNTRSKKALENGGVNVFIMVLDSMSRLNFIRQLPKTYDVLLKIYKSTVLHGLTKVGDNTYPNMMVMLSGLASSRHQLDKSLGPFFGNINASRGNFDHLPAVWKNFSSRGYVTMYAEDHPDYSTFNYLAKGFYQQPTDYYMRPFWLAMEQQKKLKSHDSRCYGHVPKHRFLLNYTEQFLNKMHQGKNAFFALSFLTFLSHDSINSVQVIDGELSSMLMRLHSSGALDNTLMLFMGDHGNRFDPIRKTVIGRVEERMPFLAVSLPKQLQIFETNLKMNQNILTSWHDVYETLMDVAMGNIAPETKQIRYGHRGLSLLRHIPSNRTCSDVGVPREYCVCWVEKELDPSETRATSAGHVVIAHLNKLLVHHKDKCAQLKLDYVLSAQLLLPSETVVTPNMLQVLLRVTVRVFPSKALLEATLERKAWSKEDKILGDVNRINRYGNESHCIHDKILNLYCYCNQDQ